MALLAEVPHRHCCWVLQTQSQAWRLNECRLDTHRAAGLATHEQLVESNTKPQPQETVEGHRHWQVLVSRIWGAMHVLSAEQAQVALLKVVPQMHWGCCRHWQSQVCVLKKCRLDTHLAAGLATHEQVIELNWNPHPQVWVDGHLH